MSKRNPIGFGAWASDEAPPEHLTLSAESSSRLMQAYDSHDPEEICREVEADFIKLRQQVRYFAKAAHCNQTANQQLEQMVLEMKGQFKEASSQANYIIGCNAVLGVALALSVLMR